MSNFADHASIFNADSGLLLATLEFDAGVTLDDAAEAAFKFINSEVHPDVVCEVEIHSTPDVCVGCLLEDFCHTKPDCLAL